MKKLTLKEKVTIYENFLHRLSMFSSLVDYGGVAELVENADKWSYMHRMGEGGWSVEKKINKAIDAMTRKLCDTPNTDIKTKTRQAAYSKNKQNLHTV
jgi:hypothetical protein